MLALDFMTLDVQHKLPDSINGLARPDAPHNLELTFRCLEKSICWNPTTILKASYLLSLPQQSLLALVTRTIFLRADFREP